MRTHLEVDPGIGLRGLEGVLPLIDEYSWAIDLEICVFPQEGLLNNPGTDELMVAALEARRPVVGAAPYTDTDPHGQIDRVFEMAREFDVDIDMHLDFGADRRDLDLDHVCRLTERVPLGWPCRDRPCHQALGRSPELFERRAQADGRCRRRADRAALDRPLSDGPAHDAQRHARGDARRTSCCITASIARSPPTTC